MGIYKTEDLMNDAYITAYRTYLQHISYICRIYIYDYCRVHQIDFRIFWHTHIISFDSVFYETDIISNILYAFPPLGHN